MLARKLIEEMNLPGVAVTDTKDPGVTGNFEITANGKLIHSKKTGGDGFLTKENQQKVRDALEEMIADDKKVENEPKKVENEPEKYHSEGEAKTSEKSVESGKSLKRKAEDLPDSQVKKKAKQSE